jgi:phosphoribosyl 1,2-cyclic phosphate phosphodiesterase
VLIEKELDSGGQTSVLIDTSPDLREQLLDAGITSLDALVYTHEHADQVHGIDDIRPLVIRRRAALPTYMNQATREILTRRFDYCFEGKGGYPPILDVQPDIVPGETFSDFGSWRENRPSTNRYGARAHPVPRLQDKQFRLLQRCQRPA